MKLNQEPVLTRAERYIDQIIIVTGNIYSTLKNMIEAFQIGPWSISRQDSTTDPELTVHGAEIEYSQMQATVCLADGVVLKLIQPVTGNTVYQTYRDRFGDGICGIRERIPADKWKAVLSHFDSLHISAAQQVNSEACKWASLNFMDQLGCIIEFISEDSTKNDKDCLSTSKKRFGQLCIATNDLQKTARFMNDVLLVGPWEIGRANERTVMFPHASDVDFTTNSEFEFIAGMGEYANFEFELIQPVKGPMPYFRYLADRDAGFHHMKEVVGKEKWSETLARYKDLGIKTYLSGKIGPCSWTNLDTAEMLGFIYELGDGVPMDRLPDGYDPYIYP